MGYRTVGAIGAVFALTLSALAQPFHAATQPYKIPQPTTAPALEEAELEALIRQLDAPSPAARDAAAERLRGLGPLVLPALRAAANTGSLEARQRLSALIAQLDRHCAIALPLGEHMRKDSESPTAGDLVLSVNGRPVDGVKMYAEAIDAPPSQSLQVQIVREGLEIFATDKAFSVRTPVASYRGTWGIGPIRALRAVRDARSNPNEWEKVRQGMEEAIAAGFDFQDEPRFMPYYAASMYYTGHREKAYDLFRQFSETGFEDQYRDWAWIFRFFEILGGSSDAHLSLWFRQRQIEADPENPEAYLKCASFLTGNHRPIEGTVLALHVLQASELHTSNEQQHKACETIIRSLNKLRLDQETRSDIMSLIRDDQDSLYGPVMLDVAARLELMDEARRMAESTLNSSVAKHGYMYPNTIAWLFQNHIQQERLKEAAELLESVNHQWSLRWALNHMRAFHCRWDDSQSLLATFARRCVENNRRDQTVLEDAFEVLHRQTTVDVNELKRIVTLRQDMPDAQHELQESVRRRNHMRYMMMLCEGNYAEAFDSLAEDPRQADLAPSVREAIRFLHEHGDRFRDGNELWRKVCWAFPRADGSIYLLTRDMKLGVFRRGGFTRIDLPEESWEFLDPDRALVMSPTGSSILTCI